MKVKKVVLTLFLSVIAVILSVIAVLNVNANKPTFASTITSPSGYTGKYFDFTGNKLASPKGFRIQQSVTGTPNTIEALIKVPTTANEGSRYGIIIGNFVRGNAADSDCFDLEVHGGGNPRIFWHNGTYSGKDTDDTANGVDWRLTNVNIATNTWTHLAFVRDAAANKFYCYVNGELVGTKDDAGSDFVPGSVSTSMAGNLSIGQDNRYLVDATDTKSTYFQGQLAYVCLSSSTKTQAQIQSSMLAMANSNATESQGNLLFVDYSKDYNYTGKGLDLSSANGYEIMESMTAAPRTFEALIRVNKNTKLSDGRYGVVIGNFYSGDVANNDCFDLEIHANGNPRLFWHNGTYSKNATDGTPNGFDWKVTSVNLNTGKWVHLAFVRDMTLDKTFCYVNGEIVASLDEAGKDIIPGTLSGSKCGGLKVGMDSRSNANTSVCFQGNVGYIALSSKTKTPSQIKQSAKLMETCAVNKEMTTSVADLLLVDKSVDRSYYTADRALQGNPNTISATFKLPKAYAVGFNGAIFTTAAVYASSHSYSLEVNQKGHLCLVWNAHKNPSANPWVEFSQDFRTGEWTNVTVVRDKTANCFKLYVNGVYKESSSTANGVGADDLSTYAPAIGSNFQTSSNERLLFRGYVKDVSVYSTALSATDISTIYNTADKTTLNKTKFSSMMLNWVLNEKQQSLYYDETCRDGLIDYSGNDNNATLCTSQHYYDIPEDQKDWFKANDDEYTLIFMPDTQITVSRDVQFYEHNANVKTIKDLDMTKTFQWMVDNKDAMNLSFVMHLGDLKHARGVSENWNAQNDWREWQLISGKSTYNSAFTTGTAATYSFSSSFINGETFGFELLKQAGIPYSTVVGNHDYNAFQMGSGTGRHADYFNYYFSSESYNEKFAKNVVARYNGNTGTWVKNNNTMMNVVYEMDATPKGSSTPVKYLVVALEYGPDDNMLNWANSIISQPQYSGHRVIFNTHALMHTDGEFMSNHSAWGPDTYGFSTDSGIATPNNGIDIFEKLLKTNDNMFMANGGHVSQESFMTRNDIGVYGNNIFSGLVDWQDSFNSRGDSFLLVAKVNEKTQKISFKVYNPVLNQFYCIENDKLEYDFSNSLTREVKKDSNVNYDKNHAKVGDSVNFSINNKQQGYIYSAIVTDAMGNVVPVEQTESGFVFTMPCSKVNIATTQELITGINLPNNLNIDFNKTIDLSQYLSSNYTYSYKVNGTSISTQGNVVKAIGKGTSTLTLSVDGYGEYATCTITTNDVSTTLPNSLTLDFADTLDLSQYLTADYTYSYEVSGSSIKCENGIVTVIGKGSASVIVSVDGYGEVASCEIITNQIATTLSSSITIKVGENLDLSTYLPNKYTYILQDSLNLLSVTGNVISGANSGTTTLIISVSGYGEVASCLVVVEQVVQTSSNSNKPSTNVTSQATSEQSSNVSSNVTSEQSSNVTSNVTSEQTSVNTTSTTTQEVSQSSNVASANTSSSSKQASAIKNSGTTQSGGGCTASVSSNYLIIFAVALVVGVVMLKKKKD